MLTKSETIFKRLQQIWTVLSLFQTTLRFRSAWTIFVYLVPHSSCEGSLKPFF